MTRDIAPGDNVSYGNDFDGFITATVVAYHPASGTVTVRLSDGSTLSGSADDAYALDQPPVDFLGILAGTSFSAGGHQWTAHVERSDAICLTTPDLDDVCIYATPNFENNPGDPDYLPINVSNGDEQHFDDIDVTWADCPDAIRIQWIGLMVDWINTYPRLLTP